MSQEEPASQESIKSQTSETDELKKPMENLGKHLWFASQTLRSLMYLKINFQELKGNVIFHVIFSAKRK